MREISQQNQELLRQALEEAQAELVKKFEIVREVRAHLRARNQESACNRADRVDDAEVKQGAVQKEQQWKEQQRKELQQKEQQFLALRKEKQQKEQQLIEAMEIIELHRKRNAKAAAARLAKR